MAPVLKTGTASQPSRVRIPVPPLVVGSVVRLDGGELFDGRHLERRQDVHRFEDVTERRYSCGWPRARQGSGYLRPALYAAALAARSFWGS